MTATVLLCTVGGSHKPVVKAIASVDPDYTCFFCTDKDPESGRPGSIVQVTGKGKVVKAHPGDKTPTLPNIPTQAGLTEERIKIRTVPADDLDGAFTAMRSEIAELASRFPDAKFVADYTGGTKTMTAALVCAALDRTDLELQLVAGARPDLLQVAAGTEQTMVASVARLRLDRTMTPFFEAWHRYAYHEAAEGLEAIRIATDSPDRARLALARNVSRALANWDDFDHMEALAQIDPFFGQIASDYPSMGHDLHLLTRKSDKRNEPARIYDLWLNAERRAVQGRYDDAVARVYRLLEWTAQWQLRTKLGIDTGDMPVEWLPSDSRTVPNQEGKHQVGLRQAWQVVLERVDGPARDFISENESELLHRLQIRNHSILAHGYQPVSADDWQKFRELIEGRFLPVFRKLAAEAGLKRLPSQLPSKVPQLVHRGR